MRLTHNRRIGSVLLLLDADYILFIRKRNPYMKNIQIFEFIVNKGN